MHLNRHQRAAGFTLIELMVAITISLIVLAALTAMFVTSSRARNEITRANQQIENGRYAMQVLSSELSLAGYFAGFDVRDITLPGAIPDPCYVPSPLPTGTNDTTLEGALLLAVQGFNNGANPSSLCGSTGFSTLTGYKTGTDILVIRRASTCVAGTTDCATLAGELYFQRSSCNEELTVGPKYRLSTNTFDRHKRGNVCGSAPVEDKRRFLTYVFYIDNSTYTNESGQVIPTLVRAELKGGNFNTKTPIAQGIEQMQFEYGIDSSPPRPDGDGIPDAYSSAPANAEDWSNVVTVKVHLLARSTDPSPGHTDDKTYQVGPETVDTADPVDANDIPADERGYKRHLFQSLVRLNNPAGFRQP